MISSSAKPMEVDAKDNIDRKFPHLAPLAIGLIEIQLSADGLASHELSDAVTK